MKLERVKKLYAEEMHTCGPETFYGHGAPATLELRTETPDGSGNYCVINAKEVSFDSEAEVDAFAERIKQFIREFCQ